MIDLRQAQVATRESYVDDIPCVVVRTPAAGYKPNTYKLFWISRLHDMSIVRYALESGGKVKKQLDITYHQSNSGVWVPNSWRYQRTAPLQDELSTVCDAQVTRCDVNPTISSTDFTLEFPTGTTVLYPSDPSLEYVVGPTSSNRPTIMASTLIAIVLVGIVAILVGGRLLRRKT